MKHQNRIRDGVYQSIISLLKDNLGYFIGGFISYRWYRDNIASYLWLKTYLTITAVVISHLYSLKSIDNSQYGLQNISLLTAFLVGFLTLVHVIIFGSKNHIEIHFGNAAKNSSEDDLESQKIESGKRSSVSKPKFDSYYVSNQDYQVFLAYSRFT